MEEKELINTEEEIKIEDYIIAETIGEINFDNQE